MSASNRTASWPVSSGVSLIGRAIIYIIDFYYFAKVVIFLLIVTICSKKSCKKANAAQPGHRRRRFAPQRAQASSPATQEEGRTLRSQESRRLACETLGGGNFFGVLLLRWDAGEDACDLCFAERLKAMARLRCGGDCRNKYHRLHNRRRRGRLRSLLCRAPKGGSQAALRGRLLHEITDAFL